MSFTVTVSLSPLCRQSRKLSQLLYHAYLVYNLEHTITWTIFPDFKKNQFYLLKKMKYSLKHRSQRQKYMMMVCIMSQKSWRLIFNWKKKHYTEFETAFGFPVSITVRYAFPIWRQIFLTVTRRPVCRNLNVKFLYDILITWWLF